MPASGTVVRIVERNALLAAALIAPLPIAPWLPPWGNGLYAQGAVVAVALCIAYAVIEEVIFRGMIQGWLLSGTQRRPCLFRLSRANLWTSSLFALAHLWQHPYWLIPGYFAVSLLLGHFRERYQGIRIPLTLHAYYNLLLLFLPGLG